MKHKPAHPLVGLSFGPYAPKCVEGEFREVGRHALLRLSDPTI
jgi:hypothetical protein